MKRMIFTKTLIPTLLCLCMLLCACGTENKKDDGKLSVVCSTFAAYDFAKQTAKELANVSLLLPCGAESHSYEPTPGDMMKIRDCDIFVYVGGESETWIEKVLSGADENMLTVSEMECTKLLEEELKEGMEAEAEEGEEEEYDEHVWTSPLNAKKICSAIADALCEKDPENSEVYKSNLSLYLSELDALDGDIRAALSDAKRNTVIFADRFPFRYFFDEYGIDYYAAFPGCSGLTEPGASTVAFLSDKVKELCVPCVFITEFSKGTIAQTICSEGDAEIRVIHSCHNISADDLANGETYISLMRKNLENLIFALN